MARVLTDKEICDDTGVNFELQIPQSTKRIDVTVSGFCHDDSKHLVIGEAEQWETVDASAKDDLVVTDFGQDQREVVHASEQAWSCAVLLEFDGSRDREPITRSAEPLPEAPYGRMERAKP